VLIEPRNVIADERFLAQPREFWASIRLISQEVGYTVPGKRTIRVPSSSEMKACLEALGLRTDYLIEGGRLTEMGELVAEYFQHRADVLNDFVQHHLMDRDQAAELYEHVRAEHPASTAPVPMNKQKGDKRAPAFFTAIINMLIEAHAEGIPVDYDPRGLTLVTRDDVPFRTLARRVDGAFPERVNPIAIWEIKEYYYTTTFGSRVADGVYETLLDGLELAELADAVAAVESEALPVMHYLFVDAHFTWWECGRSYLCRIIDMLHMGLVSEVVFGREVVDRIAAVVPTWAAAHRSRAVHEAEVENRRPGQVP
jgi:hypothetical protein